MSNPTPMVGADPFRSDPFGDAGSERTFVMPNPGARAGGGARNATSAGDSGHVAADFPAAQVGLNPLVAQANAVLNLVPQLRATSHHPDPVQLKERIAQSIREFERRARAQGIAAERVMAARYVLCTLIDEVAGSTPWGSSGTWSKQSLLVTFHNENWGGEKVFQLMARLAENVKANVDLLQLIYVVLALGFRGRFAMIEGGAGQLEQVRERLAHLLGKASADHPRALSQQWQPAVKERSAMTSWLPIVVAAVCVGALLAAIWFGLLLSLGEGSDPVHQKLAAIRLPALTRPLALAPPPSAVAPRLAGLLSEEIRAGLLFVQDQADRSTVTLRGDGLFEPASARLTADREALVQRIGAALTRTPGLAIVSGYTDDRPIRSARFPSNFELSQARAETVRKLLLQQGVPAERVRAEGRAEQDPVVPNDTPANRALNRRVEIVLLVGR